MHRPSFVNSFIAWEIGELIPVSSCLHPFFGCSCRCISLPSSTLSLLRKMENSFPFFGCSCRCIHSFVNSFTAWEIGELIPVSSCLHPFFGCSCRCIGLPSSTLSLLGKLENSFSFHHTCTRFSVAVVDASAFIRQLFHCLGNWRTHYHFIIPAPVFRLQL